MKKDEISDQWNDELFQARKTTSRIQISKTLDLYQEMY